MKTGLNFKFISEHFSLFYYANIFIPIKLLLTRVNYVKRAVRSKLQPVLYKLICCGFLLELHRHVIKTCYKMIQDKINSLSILNAFF